LALQAKRAARDFWQESVDMLATIQVGAASRREGWARFLFAYPARACACSPGKSMAAC